MFATHQPIIAAYAQQNAENLFRVLEFVQCTIQQHFYRMPAILRERDITGTSRSLSTRQNEAIAFYWAKRKDIFTELMGATLDNERMLILTDLPGFGMVKAGFVCQLVFGTVGCLDTHNIKLYGVPPSTLQLRGTPRAQLKRITAYIELCNTLGCEKLWDTWCDFVGAKYPAKFHGGFDVSALHIACIIRH